MLRILIKAGFWVFLGLMLGRFAGFFRESLIAAKFGLSGPADAVVLMLIVPDQILNLLVGGGMGASLIPEFKRLGRQEAGEVFFQAGAIVLIFFSAFAFVLSVYPEILLKFFAPGFSSELKEQSSALLGIVVWVLPLTALASVSTAYLQANGRFAVAGLGTLIFNLTLVLVLLFWVKSGADLVILAWAVLAGALIRVFTQFADSYAGGFRPARARQWRIGQDILGNYLRTVLSGSLLLALPLIARVFATYEPEGSLAAFNYASKLLELPLGTFLTIFSVVLFPKLSELFASEETSEKGVELTKDGLRIILTLSIAFALGMIWFSRDIVTVVFGWGGMEIGSIEKISALSALAMLALPAQGLSSLATAALYARKDMRSPYYINLVSLVLYIPAAFLFMRFAGLTGIMASLVLVYWCIAIADLFTLVFRHDMGLAEVFFSFGTIKTVCVGVAAFALIISVSVFSNGGIAWNLCVMASAICASFTAGLLVFEKYRTYIFSRLARAVNA